MMLAIQGRFMMCVADGICFLCLCAGYGGNVSLRVAGCRAKRKAGFFPGPGWSALCQGNHMQGKRDFPCQLPGTGESTPESKAAEETIWELTK